MSSDEIDSCPPDRILKVAAAQVAPVHRWSDRAATVVRLIKLIEAASDKNARLVLSFEHGEDITKSADVGALFRRADEISVDICVGYAEKTQDGHLYNTCAYFSAQTHSVLIEHHKSYLPGTREPFEDPDTVHQLEKHCFEEGQEGLKAFRMPGLLSNTLEKGTADQWSQEVRGKPSFGILICNDRRWSEAWRVYGLQDVELILCGCNSTSWSPHLKGTVGKHAQSKEQFGADALFHHKLVIQSNSYANSCFSICAARAGMDDDEYGLIAGSCVVGPDNKIIAESHTEDDKIVVAEIDLLGCRPRKENTFNFGKHHWPELYQTLVSLRGIIEPEPLS